MQGGRASGGVSLTPDMNLPIKRLSGHNGIASGIARHSQVTRICCCKVQIPYLCEVEMSVGVVQLGMCEIHRI
jgi:hypothetical protein